MTISFGAAGSQTSHTDTITPAYPGGAASGQLAVLHVVSGHPSASTPTTPSGWSLAGSFSGGGGSFGASTGPRRLTFFCRVLTGGDAAPTTAIPSGSSGSLISGRIVTLSRSAGTGWRWWAVFGEDITSNTSFSAAASTNVSFIPGDMCLLGYGVANNADGFSAEAASATGVTFGTVTERFDAAVTTGNGATTALATVATTAGTTTQAPGVSATLSVASTGVGGMLRVREASSSVTVTAQAVFPPRNLVTVTGMANDDIRVCTMWRTVGTDRTAVRTAEAVDVLGVNTLLRIDAEQPFGVSCAYSADLTDVNGLVWTVTAAAPLTSTVTKDVISDAVQALGALVKVETPLDKQRTRDATTFNVGGRIVAVSRPRSGYSTTLTVRTESDADGDALDQVLQAATEGVVQVRMQTQNTTVDGYFAVTEDTEAPTYYDGYRWWTLTAIETQTWADLLEAAGFTLQDIADNYPTLQDISNANATLLILAQRSF